MKGVFYMSKRRDRCKCDALIKWDTDDKEVVCKHCGTRYRVELDYFPEYWLEEIIEEKTRYRTDPR